MPLAREVGGGQRLAERGGAGVKGVAVVGLGFGRFVGHVADEGVELGSELWARLGELHGQQEIEAGIGDELRVLVGEGGHVLPDGSVHQFGQARTVLGELGVDLQQPARVVEVAHKRGIPIGLASERPGRIGMPSQQHRESARKAHDFFRQGFLQGDALDLERVGVGAESQLVEQQAPPGACRAPGAAGCG